MPFPTAGVWTGAQAGRQSIGGNSGGRCGRHAEGCRGPCLPAGASVYGESRASTRLMLYTPRSTPRLAELVQQPADREIELRVDVVRAVGQGGAEVLHAI